jgi:hypothetical protein
MNTAGATDHGNAARVMGSILLTVTRASEKAFVEGRPNGAELTAAALAEELGVAESRVRVWAAKLTRIGCLNEARATIVRRECARRVQVYRLPAVHEQRGPGRKPRWHPVALVVDPDPVAAERTGQQLHTQGMLPVSVAEYSDARHLFAHLAFELVVVSLAMTSVHAGEGEIDSLRHAAHDAGCGSVLVLHSSTTVAHPSLSLPMRSAWSGSLAGIDDFGKQESAGLY